MIVLITNNLLLFTHYTFLYNLTSHYIYLSNFQSAALYAYNDAIFSDEDWEGIQNMYESVKLKDSTKVGRFGLGFKSVFHITGEFG